MPSLNQINHLDHIKQRELKNKSELHETRQHDREKEEQKLIHIIAKQRQQGNLVMHPRVKESVIVDKKHFFPQTSD